jgi:trk system potassium uptake protein TrkH
MHWHKEFPAAKALYLSIFHSVSAFCNAGFSLFEKSFMDYPDSLILNLTICGLIVLGGIGFPVVYELYNIYSKKMAGKTTKTSLQTKSVLTTTLILILSGALFFFLLEQRYSLKGFSYADCLLPSLFQSITARTAGFNTVDFSQLGNATTSLIIFLMFIGASPGSCGGGIKTTTLFVLFSLVKNRLRGNRKVNAFKKSLGEGSLSKSVSILLISFSFITLIFFLLLLTDQMGNRVESPYMYRSYLFEVVSAFGTVGLSMGGTTMLNDTGKLLIIFTMLIGRVGILTFSYVLAGTKGSGGLEYAEENIMVG